MDSYHRHFSRWDVVNSAPIPTHARELPTRDKNGRDAVNLSLREAMSDKAFALIFWLPVATCLIIGFARSVLGFHF